MSILTSRKALSTFILKGLTTGFLNMKITYQVILITCVGLDVAADTSGHSTVVSQACSHISTFYFVLFQIQVQLYEAATSEMCDETVLRCKKRF